jgi:hypothetical protein
MSAFVSDTYDPEHDPLCWYADKDKIAAAAVNDGWPCVCDLIARVRDDECTQVKTKDNAYKLFISTLAEIGIEYKIAQHFVPGFGVKGFVSVIIFDEDGANLQCDFTDDCDFIGHEVSAV